MWVDNLDTLEQNMNLWVKTGFAYAIQVHQFHDEPNGHNSLWKFNKKNFKKECNST